MKKMLFVFLSFAVLLGGYSAQAKGAKKQSDELKVSSTIQEINAASLDDQTEKPVKKKKKSVKKAKKYKKAKNNRGNK